MRILALFLSLGLGIGPISAQSSGEPEAKPLPRAAEAKDSAREAPTLDPSALEWRSVGPVNMGGRVTDIAVSPKRASTFYVSFATGGVWRTRNAGTTFDPVFDDQGSGSIGTVAVAPSEPETVWVGTGEANARNSVSHGNGVYRSQDGGDSWTHVGLAETHHIGRIAIHPKVASTVFVAALGRVWGPNPERGLFRTRDAGKSWQHVLALDADTGCIDVRIDPEEPDTVYAAAYAVRRDGFDGGDPAHRFGEKAGIYRSNDGGDSWKKLEQGLPTSKCGRIGLDLWKSDSRYVYAIIETELSGQSPPQSSETPTQGGPAYLGVQAEDHDDGAIIREVVVNSAAATAGLENDDIILSIGDKKVDGYEGMLTAIREHRAGDTADVTVRRVDETKVLSVTFGSRPGNRIAGEQGGQGPNGQRRQGKKGFETGGIFVSEDRGETWTRINSITPRPFYYSQIRVDPKTRDNLYVLGVQLHTSTDGGDRFRNGGARGVHPDLHAMWIDPGDPNHIVLGGDGGLSVSWDRGAQWESLHLMALGQYYAVAVDQRTPYRIYGGLQDNGTWGIPSEVRSSTGITTDHGFRISGGDGFVCAVDPNDDDIVYCESQNGRIMKVNVATRDVTAVRRPGTTRGGRPGAARERYRYDWKTPFFLSPHNSQTLYFAGNHVMRSRDAGRTSDVISEELTLTDKGACSALDESPVRAGVLWAGTNDGGLYVSKDDGLQWTPVHGNLPGLTKPLWVAHVECSRTGAGVAYVILDGHRSDTTRAYVFRTDDFGATFTDLSKGLPDVPTRVLTEDPFNRDLLYVGCETGVWLSHDRGAHWTSFKSNLPTVPVHDLVVHERERELVAGTHGRSVWIVDVAPLQDFDPEHREKALHVFAPKPAVRKVRFPSDGRFGHRRWKASNPPVEASIFYWLGEADEDTDVKITVSDLLGKTVRVLEGKNKRGLNRVAWDLRERGRGGRGRGATGDGGGPVNERRGGFGRGGPMVPPGTYSCTVEVGDEKMTVPVQVVADALASLEDRATDSERMP